jgi:dipeptidyl aminopeptidase/acylaminoacyl peptidase
MFAAAVSVSGGWTPEDAPKLTKIPILAIHGKKDENVPAEFSRGVTGLINQYGGHALYFEFPEMSHQCPDQALYEDYLWDWMFKQAKK